MSGLGSNNNENGTKKDISFPYTVRMYYGTVLAQQDRAMQEIERRNIVKNIASLCLRSRATQCFTEMIHPQQLTIYSH